MKVVVRLVALVAILSTLGISHARAQSTYSSSSYQYFGAQDDAAAAPEPMADSSTSGGSIVYSDMGTVNYSTGGGSSMQHFPGSGVSAGLSGFFSSSCTHCPPFKLFGFNDSNYDVGGWTQAGYHNRSTGMFNNRPDNLNLHQQYLYFEKAADGSDGVWDWGFRTDVVYGIDAQDTQAFGNPNNTLGQPRRWDNPFDNGAYGWALPQAYLEVARGDLSIKAGHFYTLSGYETVTAPDNFFYSHAFTMFFGEPFTHTGVLGTYALNDDTELYGGWTLGWDSGFDRNGQAINFLGGFSRSLNEDMTLTYISTIGDMGARGEGYQHSIVLDTQLTERVNWVAQSDWSSLNANNPTGQFNDSIGLNQYLLYHYSDCLAAGGRVEWWKVDGGSLWAMTYGLNIRPHSNVVIRPEARYNWGTATAANALGVPVDSWIFGVDAILTY